MAYFLSTSLFADNTKRETEKKREKERKELLQTVRVVQRTFGVLM